MGLTMGQRQAVTRSIASHYRRAGKPTRARSWTSCAHGKTREDHRAVSDQLYACHARGIEVRRLLSIVGEAALSDEDRRYLVLSEAFERRFIGQGDGRRTVTATLDLTWELLAPFPDTELARIAPELLERFRHEPSSSSSAI